MPRLKGHPTTRSAVAVLVALHALLAAALLAVAAIPDGRPAAAQAEPVLFDDLAIHAMDLDFGREDWAAALEGLGEGQYLPASLTALGQTLPEVGVRLKGNSSQNGSQLKKPLKVSLDAFVDGQELAGYDVFNLNNAFVDPTFVREPLAFRALRPYMPTPASGWVRLNVNGEPFGFYVLGQRIEGRFLNAWFASNDGILFQADRPDDAVAGQGQPPRPQMSLHDGGPRSQELSPARRAPASRHQGPGGQGGFRSDLAWLGEDVAAYKAAYQLQTDADDDAPWEALRELTRALDAPESDGGPPSAERLEVLRAHLDVDGALWYLAGQNLFTNFDSYYSRHNYFLYRAEEDDRFHVLAWDMNESFGVFPGAGIDPGDSAAVARTDPFLFAGDATSRPLIRRLLGAPETRADYLAHYRTLLRRAFQPADLAAQAAAWHDLTRDAVRDMPNALYPFDTFDRGLREDLRLGSGGMGGRAVPALLGVADARAVFLSARADMAVPGGAGQPRLAHDPLAPTAGQVVTVTLAWQGGEAPSAALLEARVDGGRELRLPMTAGTSGWTAVLPAGARGDQVAYRVRLAWPDGRARFVPEGAWQDPGTARYTVAGISLPPGEPGAVVINELQADNGDTIVDPAGEHDDWIELLNRSDAPASLAGLFLSDDPEDPFAFALPDVVLGAGERLLIWADGDVDQGPEHTPFGLSKGGESLLLSTEAAVVDRVDFGPQATDHSLARIPDATGAFVDCAQPSPAAPNRCDAPPASATPTGTVSATAAPDPSPTPSPTSSAPRWRVFVPAAER